MPFFFLLLLHQHLYYCLWPPRISWCHWSLRPKTTFNQMKILSCGNSVYRRKRTLAFKVCQRSVDRSKHANSKNPFCNETVQNNLQMFSESPFSNRFPDIGIVSTAFPSSGFVVTFLHWCWLLMLFLSWVFSSDACFALTTLTLVLFSPLYLHTGFIGQQHWFCLNYSSSGSSITSVMVHFC